MTLLLLAGCSGGTASPVDPTQVWPEWSEDVAPDEEEPADEGEGSDAADDDEAPADEGFDACEPEGCIELAEAVDRGFASVDFVYGPSGLRIQNAGPYPICFDGWYAFLSTTSQDAAGGLVGSDSIEPGTEVMLDYSEWGNGAESWWCIEQNQYTSEGAAYTFNGSRAPEAIATWANDATDADGDGAEDHGDADNGYLQTQLSVWDYIDERPVFIVGRDTNWYEIGSDESVQVAVEVLNLGRVAGSVQVIETLPSGWVASDFDPAPVSVTPGEAGGVVVVWWAEFDAAVEPRRDPYSPTEYDTASFSYTLTLVGECGGRMAGEVPRVSWRDDAGESWVSEGSPLTLECCERAEEAADLDGDPF